MPPHVAVALSRLRRRVASGAFVGGAAAAWFALALAAVGAALAARLAGVPLPAGAVPVAWAVVLVGALLGGVVAARRVGLVDRDLAVHLERRLPTGGLLLAAVDGAELAPHFAALLQERLVDVGPALPRLRWRELGSRPLLAAVLLAAVTALPARTHEAGPGAATTAAVERLIADVEQVAALPGVPAELAAELRRTGEDLARRAAEGETELWREIDQLDARLARERRLAGADDAGAAAARGGAPADRATLASALERLAAAGALDRALAGLTQAQREQVAAAASADGGFDAERLPDDEADRSALQAGLGAAAEALLADRAALESLARGLGEQGGAQGLAQALADVAASLDAGGSSGAPEGAQAAPSLAEGLAEAAAQIAADGGLELLPESLRDALAETAIDAAAGALGSLDLERLAALLPKDPEALRGLAESARSLAERMAKSAAGAMPSMPQLSADAQARLAASAASLAKAMAGASSTGGERAGGPSGGAADGSASQAGGAGQGGGTGDRSGVAGASGSGDGGAAGAGTGEGAGHVALRLTADAEGGVGGGELPLTGPDQRGELPREWVPVESRKVEPEVGEATTAPGGNTTASTGGRDGEAAGGPAFELRLRPRHRELVRRYFGTTDKR